jgi:hypothetical protein
MLKIRAAKKRKWDWTKDSEVTSIHSDVASIHGDVASIHGDVTSIHGDVASIHGDDASIHGDVASIHGDIASIHGDDASIHGDVASIHGDVTSIHNVWSVAQKLRFFGVLRLGQGRMIVKEHDFRTEKLLNCLGVASRSWLLWTQLRYYNSIIAIVIIIIIISSGSSNIMKFIFSLLRQNPYHVWLYFKPLW